MKIISDRLSAGGIRVQVMVSVLVRNDTQEDSEIVLNLTLFDPK